MGSFETSDQNSAIHLRPLRVPTLKGSVYNAAKEMVEALAGWKLLSEDQAQGLLVCEKKGGLLSGNAKITIRIEGPEGVPSTTVTLRSESSGGLLGSDKANVAEFLKPFHRRVC